MERLTIRNSDGSVSQPTRTSVEAAFYRLADYEDTGLTPGEVQIVAEMLAGDPYVPILQVSNLVKAYREGRVEILPPNDPLTPEELREMDGEPVWVKCLEPGMGHLSCWGIRNSDFVDGYHTNYCDTDYGKGWLAYRRRPEGNV